MGLQGVSEELPGAFQEYIRASEFRAILGGFCSIAGHLKDSQGVPWGIRGTARLQGVSRLFQGYSRGFWGGSRAFLVGFHGISGTFQGISRSFMGFYDLSEAFHGYSSGFQEISAFQGCSEVSWAILCGIHSK